MAKKSKIARNEQRKVIAERYRERRAALKAALRNPATPAKEREAAFNALCALPRDSSPTRIRNRCALTGRPRAYYREFGLSRIALREMALRGEIPGVVKSSW